MKIGFIFSKLRQKLARFDDYLDIVFYLVPVLGMLLFSNIYNSRWEFTGTGSGIVQEVHLRQRIQDPTIPHPSALVLLPDGREVYVRLGSTQFPQRGQKLNFGIHRNEKTGAIRYQAAM